MPAARRDLGSYKCICAITPPDGVHLETCVQFNGNKIIMPPKDEPSELQRIVAEMRELGVTEYSKGGVRVVLGAPAVQAQTEKSELEQQRIRDEREKMRIERENRIRFGASSRIAARPGSVK